MAAFHFAPLAGFECPLTWNANLNSEIVAEDAFFDRKRSIITWNGTLEFGLHVLPGGTLADKLVTGEGTWGEAGLATVGDAAFFIGLWAKTAKGTRAIWLARTAVALEAGTGLYAGGQAGYYLSQGDLTGATRSGVEAMLILWGVKGDLEDVVSRLKKPNVTSSADEISSELLDGIRPNNTIDNIDPNASGGANLFSDIQGKDLSKLTNPQIGNLGEGVAKKLLEANGFTDIIAIQNRSGNGIDIIAKAPDGRISFFEVKTSSTGRIPELSARQKDARSFIEGTLFDAANGRGRYKSIDAQTQQTAGDLLRAFQRDPANMFTSMCAIGIDLKNQHVLISPWR